MRFKSRYGGALIASCVAGLCVALAAPAVAADNGEYPTDPGARTFNGGANGWSASYPPD